MTTFVVSAGNYPNSLTPITTFAYMDQAEEFVQIRRQKVREWLEKDRLLNHINYELSKTEPARQMPDKPKERSFSSVAAYSRALAQYNIDYIEHKKKLDQWPEQKNQIIDRELAGKFYRWEEIQRASLPEYVFFDITELEVLGKDEIESDPMDKIAANRGWNPLTVGETMVVHFNESYPRKSYKISRET